MKNELMIVWTTSNRDTILNMICLYALNAKLKGWFDEVTVLVWGASQQVLSEDNEIRETVIRDRNGDALDSVIAAIFDIICTSGRWFVYHNPNHSRRIRFNSDIPRLINNMHPVVICSGC